MQTKSNVRLGLRLEDARRLIEIHEEATGNERGRRHGYDVLNRSVIIVAVAAWEGFVEDLLEAAVIGLSRNASGPSKLPVNVREAMIAHLYSMNGWNQLNSSTKTGIWDLTGRGWRKAYITYAKARISNLDSPSYENVKKLYSSVIGLPDFAQNWQARRWSAETYKQHLQNLILLRNRVAHGAIGEETVGKSRAQHAVTLVERIANWTETKTVDHMKTLGVRLRHKKQQQT